MVTAAKKSQPWLGIARAVKLPVERQGSEHVGKKETTADPSMVSCDLR